MNDKQLYQQILGLSPPWTVTEVVMKAEAREILVRVDCPAQKYACPKCNKRMHIHAYKKRRWRHLDSCQFKTIIEASVPRVKCEEHGTQIVQVPWAEKHSRFTLLFERFAIDVLQSCSIQAASELLRISWDEADGIKNRAVKRGLARKERYAPGVISIDEKAVGSGHDYFTLVVALKNGQAVVDHVVPGRTANSLDSYWQQWSEEERTCIQCIGMDMWEPYLISARAHVPEADQKIVHDRFHLMQMLNKGLDNVRRSEMAWMSYSDAKELKGTRQMWLYGFENLPEKWSARMQALKDSTLKTARAWRLKEMFREMYSMCTSAIEALAYFKEWYGMVIRSQLKPMMEAAKSFKRHWDQIATFFVHYHGTAHSEGMNSKVQALIKRANGYRNRKRLINDLYFHLGGLSLYPETPN
jgi:transposase